jgi:hypothetical protein
MYDGRSKRKELIPILSKILEAPYLIGLSFLHFANHALPYILLGSSPTAHVLFDVPTGFSE